MLKLQDFLADIPFESLPPVWTTFDLETFSRDKRLYDYQQKALQFALRALWKYYQDCGDYRPGETDAANTERKRRLFEWYRLNGLDADISTGLNAGLDIPLGRQRRDIRALLEEYFPAQDDRIPYQHLINRMGFWMATGSGKTLVIVKLLELVWRLGRAGEIPAHDLLVLTHRDDLLEQLRLHVDEFNAQGEPAIRLRDLREYPEAKRETASLFRDREITVFIYRSDNLSDEQKERIIDFRNYDNHGRWYILLDEAHKGDKEDSKRQHLYNILARNGFLFNFSATFTDDRDILTTAYDFNLARFIESGYGKHIAILRQENRAFGDKEDYTGAEKQKVVLKALLMLAYARRAHDSLPPPRGEPEGGLYHRPLMLTLVNSVNIKDADLKLFFRELERIGKGEMDDGTWRAAKAELWQELAAGPGLMFEGERFSANEALFEALTPQDVLAAVYNAAGPGEVEVWVRPSNRQEMAFKLKSAERPFALIKIGEIGKWLKEELEGYDILEGFEDEGFFQRLNEDDSDINILMGSRSFYEGWDSNRPNVITFINIGTGTEARKFILQSVGRGVRIEPLPGRRKRLQSLYNAGDADARALYPQIRERVLPLETLFIFGTNRQALQTVIEQLDLEQGKEAVHQIALELNRDALDDHLLLIPTYRLADRPLVEQRTVRKFEIAADELDLLQRYVAHLGDGRLLVARHGATPRQVDLLQKCLAAPLKYFNPSNGRRFGRVDLALDRLFGYFQVIPQEVEGLKPLADEINHFRHTKVLLQDVSELQEKIARAQARPRQIAELRARYEAGQLSFDELLSQGSSLRDAEVFHTRGHTLQIKHIANHYYVPIILSDDARIEYIRHIIRHPSEVRFVKALDGYVQQAGNAFEKFDWWLFSKLDETLDGVYLPYYDPDANRVRRFIPDFIFWLQQGDDYFIAFVDPKGMQHVGYQYKLAGYEALFLEADSEVRLLEHNGLKARVCLFLYTQDAHRAPPRYAAYWYDHPEAVANGILRTRDETLPAG